MQYTHNKGSSEEIFLQDDVQRPNTLTSILSSSGNKMKTVLIAFTVLLLVENSCQTEPVAEPNATGPNVKISVLRSGKVLIDGTESTVAQVEQSLTQLKAEGGTVWYYREAARQQEPPPVAMQVMDLVAERALPITFSSKPDFSDYIGQDGQTRPRE